MSAFLLWATAGKECGSELTRDRVMAELETVEEWTGDGLHAPAKPSENLPPECGLVLKLSGTSFERFAPIETGMFDCSPDYVVEITGPVVQRTNLNADRIVQPG